MSRGQQGWGGSLGKRGNCRGTGTEAEFLRKFGNVLETDLGYALPGVFSNAEKEEALVGPPDIRPVPARGIRAEDQPVTPGLMPNESLL